MFAVRPVQVLCDQQRQLRPLRPLHLHSPHMPLGQARHSYRGLCHLPPEVVRGLVTVSSPVETEFSKSLFQLRRRSVRRTTTGTACPSSWASSWASTRPRRRASVPAVPPSTPWWRPTDRTPSASKTGPTRAWGRSRWRRGHRPSCSRAVSSWRWPSGGRRPATSWTRSTLSAGSRLRTTLNCKL